MLVTGIWLLNQYVLHVLVPWFMILADIVITIIIRQVTYDWVVSK